MDVGKCSSQRGPGKDFPEFFEKSIDKQKIDAILNGTVRFWSGPGRGARRQGGAEPCCVIERLREAATIPIQEVDGRRELRV